MNTTITPNIAFVDINRSVHMILRMMFKGLAISLASCYSALAAIWEICSTNINTLKCPGCSPCALTSMTSDFVYPTTSLNPLQDTLTRQFYRLRQGYVYFR